MSRTVSFLACLALISGHPLVADPLPDDPPALTATWVEQIPAHLRDRSTREARLGAIAKLGGFPESEEAVVKALDFLQSTQRKDGSWAFEYRQVSITALALLCFLGHGEQADLDQYGVTILNGLTFLIDRAVQHRGNIADDYRSSSWPYDHAVSVYVLAEAHALWEKGHGEEIKHLRRAVEVGGQIIINRQHKGGGWDYNYSEDSARGGDTSLTIWHLLALKACKNTGLEFVNMRKCHKKGVDYLERMQAPSGAFGYASPNHLRFDGTSLAAAGALGVQIWEGKDDKVARKAVKFIDAEMKFGWDTPHCDLCGHFFAAQAMINHGGEEWDNYHQMVFPEILNNQEPDGSFRIVNEADRKGVRAPNAWYADKGALTDLGRHYRTCLATLILESYYR